MSDLLEAALTYAARGWPVFPLKPRGKKPLTDHGYKNATCASEQLNQWWVEHPEANIGVALGAARLAVVDLDRRHGGHQSLANLEAEHGPIPATLTAITGDGLHRYYVAPPGASRLKLEPAPGLEVRRDGHYVVAPPSVHPSGHVYVWSGIVTEPTAFPVWLLKLLQPAHRGPQSRASRDFAEAAEQWNADHGEDWGEPGKGQCPACGHRDCFGRLPENTARWFCFSAAHERDSGGCGLAAPSGQWSGDALDLEAHARRCTRAEVLRKDLYFHDAHDQPAAPVPPRKILVRGQLGSVARQATDALLANAEGGIYVRAGMLVRVTRSDGQAQGAILRERGAPIIESLTVDALRSSLDAAAQWVAWDERKKLERPTLPPLWAVRAILAEGSWPFPYLEGVIESPTFKPDGELLVRPGYDTSTGLLLLPDRNYPRVSDRPNAEEVDRASALLGAPLEEFPFVAATDQAAALALVLSLVARHGVDGCVPMFTVRATAPGTGKGLLADVAALIGTGRAPARMALPADDDSLRKSILPLALDGTRAILLDNVDRPLGSHALAAALTSGTWKDRLLGQSRMAEAPLRAVWVATGNNITFKGDLARRVVPIDLDAGLEHPEDRGDFRRPNLLAWVREHRHQLVPAALTILRAYHLAGRPEHGLGPRKGSFELWDDLVRGACVWAGFGDPLESAARVRSEDDSDLGVLKAALTSWREVFDDGSRTAADAVKEALHRAEADDPDLRDALLGLLPDRDRLDARALGYALRQKKGRRVDRMRFEQGKPSRRGVATWRVEVLGMPGIAGDDSSSSFSDGSQRVTSE